MPDPTYTDLPLVAYEDHDAGLLVIATTINGVTVPVATQKLGLYSEQIAAGAKQPEQNNQGDQPS